MEILTIEGNLAVAFGGCLVVYGALRLIVVLINAYYDGETE